MAKIIQITGTSGTGKDTLKKSLSDRLISDGYKVESLVEPGPLRDFAKCYRLRHDKNPWTETAIFTADRFILYENVIPRLEEQGLLFLVVRGFLDTAVYQGLLGGVNVEIIKKMNEGIPLPNLVLCLLVDGNVGYERILKRAKATGETISSNETAQGINRLREYYNCMPYHFSNLNIHFLDNTNLNENQTFEWAYEKVMSVL